MILTGVLVASARKVTVTVSAKANSSTSISTVPSEPLPLLILTVAALLSELAITEPSMRLKLASPIKSVITTSKASAFESA